MIARPFSLLLMAALLSAGCSAHPAAELRNPTELTADPSVQTSADGVTIHAGETWVRLQVRTPQTIRVTATRLPAFFDQQSLVTVASEIKPPAFRILMDKDSVSVNTGVVSAMVDRTSGRVSFTDSQGKPIVSESGRTLEPAIVQGVETFNVRQQWKSQDESLYGLGQHQFDSLNLKGLSVDLWQRNTSIVVPLLVSSRGYGIFWNNLGYTRFGDLRDWQPLGGDDFQTPIVQTRFTDDGFGNAGGKESVRQVAVDFRRNRDFLLADGKIASFPTTGPISERPRSYQWSGEIVPQKSGQYQFHNYSNGRTKVTVGETVLFDHFRQGWLPADDVATISLEAGKRYAIHADWSREGGGDVYRLDYKTPATSDDTSLWSEFGDGVDYYLIAGGSIDGVVAGMRELTGRATMPPQWVFGLWQSRQRYETQQASLDVVDGFRSRGIPFDNIVQDWQYWQRDQWGSHEFDKTRFPDPIGWINAIHDRHAHLMISVWGKLYSGTANYQALLDRGFLYTKNIALKTVDWLGYAFSDYDAFNPEARKLFWQQMKVALFDKGVDAWWMDATEPDLESTPTLQGLHQRMNPTAAGPSAGVLNGYALENARAVFEGQRQAAPDQRVFNLTRSGYAGQQRYGAASWSGDITSTWTAMQKQIPAGLNFCISGVPYWTMDSGGFSLPPRFSKRPQSTDATEEWRELNTRWFEFATFVPLLRVHGEFPFREMWEFGGDTSDAYRAMLKFDQIRYQLFPYIYSLASEVTRNDGTILRAMAFDFPDDPKARDLTDQFLFGRSIMVSPVTSYKARQRSVYLPGSCDWYDFWSGEKLKGGQRLNVDAPYDRIPLHIRAGSIIPAGSAGNYIGEASKTPTTILVYTGADADFVVEEDDGLTNRYETGQFSKIPIHWSERDHVLSIGTRHGSFDGMMQERSFNVVLFDGTLSHSDALSAKGISVDYSGRAIAVMKR